MRHPGSEGLSLAATSPEATAAIAEALGKIARAGDFIALDGELGAGKTFFTAAFAEALGVVPGEVDSPSYVLLNEYRGRLPVFHFDAYRLESSAPEGDGGDAIREQLEEIGFFDERLDEGVTLLEWASRVGTCLPAHALRLRIEILAEGQRRVIVHEPDERTRAALADFAD